MRENNLSIDEQKLVTGLVFIGGMFVAAYLGSKAGAYRGARLGLHKALSEGAMFINISVDDIHKMVENMPNSVKF